MVGIELLKIGEIKYKFIKTDGKYIHVHRIVNITDEEIEYTTMMPNFINDEDLSKETKSKIVRISDIKEIIKK